MSQTRYNWTDIRARLYALADAIGEKSCGSSWPVVMRNVVRCRATLSERQLPVQLIFRPLWADGCVVVTDSGFEIYISCNKEETEDLENRYQSEHDQRRLPPRLRYTIAHEVAHTLLYESAGGDPRGKIRVDHHAILSALESSCEEAGARILLPTNMVRNYFKSGSPCDPDLLRALAESANVSFSAVIQRLGAMGSTLGDEGAFAYVIESGTGREITSFSANASIRPIFQQVRKGRPASTFLRATTKNFVLNGGDRYVDAVEFKEQPEWARHFEFRCESKHSRGDRQGFFVTARLLTGSAAPVRLSDQLSAN